MITTLLAVLVMMQAPAPASTPKASAPIDLSGYWVSLITEDWHYRMVTPPKGMFQGVPMTAEATTVANSWDPAKDEAAQLQCRAYGAAGIMRLPGRLHITWQDDQTLRVDTDAGTQTRLLQFRPSAPGGQPTWQGHSIAEWETRLAGRAAAPVRTGSLKVVTTNMRSGYLRKNGIPYSDKAVLTEYVDVIQHSDGSQLLIVTSVVEDPQYLRIPFETSSHFKKQKDSTGWEPTPCSATW